MNLIAAKTLFAGLMILYKGWLQALDNFLYHPMSNLEL